MGARFDLGQPFRPRQKSWVRVGEGGALSRYNIRAEGTLPPSITVIARFFKIHIKENGGSRTFSRVNYNFIGSFCRKVQFQEVPYEGLNLWCELHNDYTK